MKEKNKNIIVSFRVTPEEKVWIEEHSYGHYRRISDFVRDCIFKKEIVGIDGADEIAHELHASATISISLPVPSMRALFGRLTSEKPSRRCKKYGNR